MNITDVDPNFKQKTATNAEFKFFSPKKLGLEGFPWEDINKREFCRLPDRIIPMISEYDGLFGMAGMSAGGVIRFNTDSKALLIKGCYRPVKIMQHMPLTGMAGFDVMIVENGKERLLCNLVPDVSDIVDKCYEFTLSCNLPGGMNEYRIYMPLLVRVDSFSIGLTVSSQVDLPSTRRLKPILFYGSSITQGACVSRPSNSYCALVARAFNAEQINLGFAGCAKGELPIAKEIAQLELSCFVMDYDHNAPTTEYLKTTHEIFFKTVRNLQPDLPIVIVSRPFAEMEKYDECRERHKIIMETYTNALNQNDKNVYFVDGMRVYDEIGIESGTVDLIHPNDLGFYFIAKKIIPVVRQALSKCGI